MNEHSSFMAEVAIRAAAEDICIRMTQPHVLMRPSISIEGNKWCALYGENLQDGVSGFGDSPAEAMSNFDLNWYKTIKKASA